jgi:trehalose-phosphatase
MTEPDPTPPPPAATHAEQVRARLAGRRLAVFLDHDGTLSPIVDDPAAATIPPRTRALLERLAARVPTAIVSGRDLTDLRQRVGIPSLIYAGSHGFEIAGPGLDLRRGDEFLPALDAAEQELVHATADLAGSQVERKSHAIAVHHRRLDDAAFPELERRVTEVAARHDDLRLERGKKILELRPDLEWDKGAAVCWLLETMGLDGDDVVPVYVGDDVTDEDAFRALADRGLGFVVDAGDRPTAADYHLSDLDDVTDLLAQLADLADRPAG